jgi:hypothetical protein
MLLFFLRRRQYKRPNGGTHTHTSEVGGRQWSRIMVRGAVLGRRGDYDEVTFRWGYTFRRRRTLKKVSAGDGDTSTQDTGTTT